MIPGDVAQARNRLIDSLKAEVIRVGAERDAALAEAGRLTRDLRDTECERQAVEDFLAKVDNAAHAYFQGVGRPVEFGYNFGEAIDRLPREANRLAVDAARLDLLESRLVCAVWVECGRGRLFRLTMIDGRSFEATTARGAIDAAMEDTTQLMKGNKDDNRT